MTSFSSTAPQVPASSQSTGALDGLTIVRFAHAFTSGGGMERIMADLDEVLLARNAVTIVRMYIASDPSETERTEVRGRGKLILVPLPLAPGDSRQLASDHEQHGMSFKQVVRNQFLYNPLVWSIGGDRYVLNRRLRRRKGEVVGAGVKFAEVCNRYSVDLCMMHFFGSSDADEVIQEAKARGLPIALENHYANDRFMHLAIRKHAMLADAVSGMNGLDVPPYLNGRFTNLADGIDLSCFDRAKATPPASVPPHPLLLLPSRIVRPKGHLDVVQAAARLRDNGIKVSVGFAGRVDSSDFVGELKSEITRTGLDGSVFFLGELNPTQLRDWYAASAVLVFPTYHHEGLGRIIVEAQAMEVPVVAYGTGGVREGLVDGETGFLVRTGDVAGLTGKIALLVRDPARRRVMGAAGRQFVSKHYSLESLAQRHESFYRSVIEKKRTHGGATNLVRATPTVA